MAYFRTSYEAIHQAAASGRYEDLAAFLVIARHANGLPPGGLAPYTFSGAGINAVHEKAGVSEETARGALLRLQEIGLIRPVSPEVKKLSYMARWEINQRKLDADLPHAITDSGQGVASALRRIREMSIPRARQKRMLDGVSDSELRCDALLALMATYNHTSMSRFGGLSPRSCYRSWEVKSKSSKSGGVRWGAEPSDGGGMLAYFHFMEECIPSMKKSKDSEPTEAARSRFWTAWEGLIEFGLVYEAVTMFDVDPKENTNAQMQYTLRVNDYHAGATSKDGGDPNLLALLEEAHGTAYAYYTNTANDRSESEAMWLILPKNTTGTIVGIWRPRFRPATADTGSWYQSDSTATETQFWSIEEAVKAQPQD